MVIRRRRSLIELQRGPPSARYYNAVAKKIPIIDWAPLYSIAKLRSDVIAGLTVGLMVVPQSLAYATNIAELPARYGLYSSYIGVIIYMFFGTSKDVTLGPTAIMSKIVEQATGSSSASCSKNGAFTGITNCGANKCCEAVAKAAKLCMFAGIINFLMGFLSLGFLVDFISLPVLYGFTTSASLTIAAGQIHSLIGISGSHANYPHVPEIFSKFPNIFKDTFESIDKDGEFGWKYPDILMSIVCISLTIGLQKLKGKMDKVKNPNALTRLAWFLGAAGNFFTVAIGTVLAKIVESISKDAICSKGHTDSNHTVHGAITHNCLTLTGHIDPGLPSPEIPDFKASDIGDLISGAILVALIGYLESIAIAKAFARSNGYEVDASQELVAIGASNMASSFFQSYPVTGSFSRTAVNSASSVSTPASGVVTGTVVIVALLVMTSLMAYIPKAALGAIVIVSVLKMFNYKIVLKMWKVNKIEILPWAVSFFGCTFLSIEYGVGAGAGINILMILYYTARPKFSIDTEQTTRVVKIGSSVLYPAGASWKDNVRIQLDDPMCKSMVLDLSMVGRLDYTGVQTLNEITEDAKKERVSFALANASPAVVQMLESGGYFETYNIQRESVTQSVEAAVASAEQGKMDPEARGNENTPLLAVN